MTTEIWKEIPGYEGLYQVSSTGKVKSLDRYGRRGKSLYTFIKGKELSLCYGRNGYVVTGLSKGGITKQFTVHSLVMLAFVGERPEGFDICHGDGDRQNNRLENLRYDTKSANANDKKIHGTNNEGDTNPRAKLNAEQVLEIYKRCQNGEPQVQIAEELKLSLVTVNHIATGRTWNATTGAYWNRKHAEITPKIVAKIAELQSQGMSLEKIAKELGISKASAFRHSKNKSALLKQDGVSTITGDICE